MQLISDFPKEGHHSYEVTVMISLHRVLLMSLNELSAIAEKPMLCKKNSGVITGQTVQVFIRNVQRNVFSKSRKRFWREIAVFRRHFIANGFEYC